MRRFTIATAQKDQIIDITDEVQAYLGKNDQERGVCHIFISHTTCAITTADLDPGTDLDFLDALRTIAPQITYRHPHDPSHAPDHILASIIGSSVSVPFEDRQLVLGTWQRIVLVELDGPRQRTIVVSFIS